MLNRCLAITILVCGLTTLVQACASPDYRKSAGDSLCKGYLECMNNQWVSLTCGGQWNPNTKNCDDPANCPPCGLSVSAAAASQLAADPNKVGSGCNWTGRKKSNDPDCKKFLTCEGNVIREDTCGGRFDSVSGNCGYSGDIPCTGGSASATTPATSSASVGGACNWQGDKKKGSDALCKNYLVCNNNKIQELVCEGEKLFNPVGQYCDWAGNVVCKAPSPAVTVPADATTPAAGATVPASGAGVCVGTAQYQVNTADPDCTSFLQCDKGVTYKVNCPAGLKYNTACTCCDWPQNVPCASGGSTSATTPSPNGSPTVPSNGATTPPVGSTPSPLTVAPGSALITRAEFDQALALNGMNVPNAAELYNNLVTLCGPAGGIFDKRELAMFLAQIMWESDGLKAKREYACEYSQCPGSYDSPKNGQYFYGRGYIQLSWPYNYAAASQALYNDDRLVRDADMVARDDAVAWATAMWYWKANCGNRAGVKAGQFGDATRAINGGLECGTGHYAPAKRFTIYTNVMKAFNLSETPNPAGC